MASPSPSSAAAPLAPAAIPSTPLNILILCTGNSARSILGEALFAHLGAGRVNSYSAGSHPGGTVNPVALETLTLHQVPHPIDTRSKSWNEFMGEENKDGATTIKMDYIFTVCSNAANEQCPFWPGNPTTAHWCIDDPAHIEPIDARRVAFEVAYQQLEKRISAFLALPIETMKRKDVIDAARRIHEECQ